MKVLTLAVLILATQAVRFETGVVAVSGDSNVQGRYDECMPMIQHLTLHVGQLGAAIAAANYWVVPGLAVAVGQDLYDSIECFQNHTKSPFELLAIAAEPDECVMKHMKNAIAAIKLAIQDLSMKMYKEAIEQFKIAILELGEAQICPH